LVGFWFAFIHGVADFAALAVVAAVAGAGAPTTEATRPAAEADAITAVRRLCVL
jgi:hypothetical protein